MAVHTRRHTYDPTQLLTPWVYAIPANPNAIGTLEEAINKIKTLPVKTGFRHSYRAMSRIYPNHMCRIHEALRTTPARVLQISACIFTDRSTSHSRNAASACVSFKRYLRLRVASLSVRHAQ